MYCRSDLIWDVSHYDQRLMRAFFPLKAGVRFRINRSFYRSTGPPTYHAWICTMSIYLVQKQHKALIHQILEREIMPNTSYM